MEAATFLSARLPDVLKEQAALVRKPIHVPASVSAFWLNFLARKWRARSLRIKISNNFTGIRCNALTGVPFPHCLLIMALLLGLTLAIACPAVLATTGQSEILSAPLSEFCASGNGSCSWLIVIGIVFASLLFIICVTIAVAKHRRKQPHCSQDPEGDPHLLFPHQASHTVSVYHYARQIENERQASPTSPPRLARFDVGESRFPAKVSLVHPRENRLTATISASGRAHKI